MGVFDNFLIPGQIADIEATLIIQIPFYHFYFP